MANTRATSKKSSSSSSTGFYPHGPSEATRLQRIESSVEGLTGQLRGIEAQLQSLQRDVSPSPPPPPEPSKAPSSVAEAQANHLSDLRRIIDLQREDILLLRSQSLQKEAKVAPLATHSNQTITLL
jgi:hypothetical protein